MSTTDFLAAYTWMIENNKIQNCKSLDEFKRQSTIGAPCRISVKDRMQIWEEYQQEENQREHSLWLQEMAIIKTHKYQAPSRAEQKVLARQELAEI